jgi:hypothetical protein
VKDLLPTHPNGNNRVWPALSYWINFETWLSFEKEPKVERFSEEAANIGLVLA